MLTWRVRRATRSCGRSWLCGPTTWYFWCGIAATTAAGGLCSGRGAGAPRRSLLVTSALRRRRLPRRRLRGHAGGLCVRKCRLQQRTLAKRSPSARCTRLAPAPASGLEAPRAEALAHTHATLYPPPLSNRHSLTCRRCPGAGHLPPDTDGRLSWRGRGAFLKGLGAARARTAGERWSTATLSPASP